MSRELDEKAQKIHNPQAEFDKPSDVVRDSELSRTEKKRRWTTWSRMRAS